MTTSEPPRRRGRENAAQRRLEQQFHRMVSDLHGVLDLDAGLHEIMAGPPHDDLVEELGRAFDLDAGLRDILGTASSEPAAPGIGAPEPGDRPGSAARDIGDLEVVLAARANRAVRQCLDLLAAARAHDLAGVVEYARDLVDQLAFYGADAITFARARAASGIDARTLVDELADAVIGLDVFVRARPDSDIDVCAVAREYARALVKALTRSRAGIKAIRLAFAFATKVDAVTRSLVEAVDRGLSDSDALARDLVEALAVTRSGAEDLHSRVVDAQRRADAAVRNLLSVLEAIVSQGLSRTLPGIDLERLPADRISSLLMTSPTPTCARPTSPVST